MASRKPLNPAAAQSLALAMIASSEAPLLLLDGTLAVIGASASFCRTYEIDPTGVGGQKIFDLGEGEWNSRKLRSLLNATRSGNADIEAYEMDLRRSGHETRQIVVHARRLAFAEVDTVRVLVTLSDVTDALIAKRLNESLLREKAILLQEVHHRVANSLQIIASVLMQSARRVQSEETRAHLQDAHHRVLSIATVQKQLAISHLGDVELRPYFNQLCESLGASMIADPKKLTIEVHVDEAKVNANTSVSLGLIVTELVINALKHAFPDGQGGKIMVDYAAKGPNWTLSVRDNGVGMSNGPEPMIAGLGSSIVDALAQQLRAKVTIANARPGASVSIVHKSIAAVEKVPKAVAV